MVGSGGNPYPWDDRYPDPVTMSQHLIDRDDAGDWGWNHPAVDVEERFETPSQAVEAGIEALRGAVDDGALSASQARELAADARFALGTQEHHLGGSDQGAFEALSSFEDELASDA